MIDYEGHCDVSSESAIEKELRNFMPIKIVANVLQRGRNSCQG